MITKWAFRLLKKAIQTDPDLAWVWHCNIAVSMQDEGMEYMASNRGAARFMQICFDVDTDILMKNRLLKHEEV